ncbi:MAG TPA: endopeptidase La [Acholeplasmataceae bacterium]|jgi:ATP-dependent Lon protease|nr:endopeptidase La [Acholeplasmataceae bacterium]
MYKRDVNATGTLPTIVTNSLALIPDNEVFIDIAKSKSLESLRKAESKDKYLILLVQKDQEAKEIKNASDCYGTGILARAVYVQDKSSYRKVKFELIVRVSVEEFNLETFETTFKTKPANVISLEEEAIYKKLLVAEVGDPLKAGEMFSNAHEITRIVKSDISVDEFINVLAYNLKVDNEKKHKYLETADIQKRFYFILDDIQGIKYINQLEQEINSKIQKSISESQKEFYLREKMRAIQDELGDKAIREQDVESLREKILAAKMPQATEEKALEELKRYSTINPSSPESTVSKTYLDFLVDLPWYKKTEEVSDINKAKEQLDKDHYGLEKVKERILEYIAVHIQTKKNPLSILCLVGPPGVGKTSLASSIAKALNKKFVKQSLGGIRDVAEIIGHRRTYVGALPGRILQGMKKAGVINPVFLLDEIDKLSSDYRGDPASAMLEVLDPEQNKYFSDNYLEEPYDLSHVFFILTANYLEDIPYALRDRLEIVELSSYTEYEKFEIAKRHLIPKQLELNGLDKDFVLEDDALWEIIRKYTREAGVRELERMISSLIRKVIKKMLLEKAKDIKVKKEDIETYLGKPIFLYNQVDLQDQVGVVTGLAYTHYGGDTLSVEATYFKGQGNLQLTGQLGDVMKESAQAALSYVKANAAKFNIDPKIFKDVDIHIHVPEGAVPKDGPSAGVTIATALVSLFSNKKVKHDVGMTGEVTLRGNVLPIGGLKEKSIAAARSGLKTILIPKENERDITDIPELIQKDLSIILINSVEDAVGHALE